jgi:cobyrinic acid a,c-diamide synthase
MKAFVVAGTASGVGKTTIATGLMAALRTRGLRVQGFKVGPDYIDPQFHTLATGRSSRNLDSWLVPTPTLRALFRRALRDAQVAVIEGVMGLYDGRHGGGEEGSTAEVAKLLALPVVLVVDASRQARSAAAQVLGFRAFDPDLRILGVVLNRVGSTAHRDTLIDAIESRTGLPVLGAIPRAAHLVLPERYLGLIPPSETPVRHDFAASAAETVARWVNLDALLQLADYVSPPPAREVSPFPLTPARCHGAIGVARDRAFGFYYADALELLEAAGLELREFSPLADPSLPPGVDGLYIGGGFPERFASDLAANHSLLRDLRHTARRGLPIYAECGGYMYLTRAIVDEAGQRHPMAGLIPTAVSLLDARLSLGYRPATAARDSLLWRAGEPIRAHEFHYSRCLPTRRPPPAYCVQGRDPQSEGMARGNLLASYLHVHLACTPEAPRRFAAACAKWRASVAA